MVVEPDVLVRMVIAEYLRDCGYKVIEGVSAKDVWAVLDGGRAPDVLLVDVKLSGKEDGFMVAKRVRQTRKDIDVMLTSGVASTVQQSHELCEEGPIQKPYDPKDVEARIRILLERRRAAKKS
ncbi:MAG TPA: response regulator [Steroidobacteraceae bacterium]|nr:response regulator [Steroidobacteraceae bacterium]